MASTFSDLKIELIGTGEQVGSWGNTTNANLGIALEEAVVGSAAVAFSSADVTLTLTNTNGTQSARHLRLNLTGTSGGARNLILGSGCQIDKPYIINNGLANLVTVKNTTGTGVVVPAGKTMWVFNNGVNVVEVVNHASSMTLSTPLPVASGGTGTNTLTGIIKGNGTSPFTVGNVNLASEVTGTLPVANGGTGVTSSTGTGSVVLSTSPTLSSPTLVTPILGTPQSGTLTNATGLPIVAGTTGTLSVARGGTGNVTGNAINVTGIVAVVNGGSGVTTSTGSGNVVLSNSPTLVTPVLGTPASATLTNATNLPIVAGTTGTLSVARGGTGATTLTANNVVIGNGTSAVGFVAPSTSGNLLTSNGTTWTSAPAAPAFLTGMIILWSGSIASIPAGFALCNGANGTPDLRDRFVIGAGNTHAVNATGGSNDSTLPTHNHTATSTVTDPGHNHTLTNYINNPLQAGSRDTASAFISGTQSTDIAFTSITVGTTIANAGTSGVGTNRPPFFALAYIMKL